MTPRRIWLITFGAYLPASSLPALAALVAPGAQTLDPALLTVPFCAGFGVGFPLWGAFVDRLDRVRMIVVALLLLAAAHAVVALAESHSLLVAGRVLAGLAAAGVPPAAQGLLAERAAGGAGGRLAGMMVAVGVATLGGPLLAQALAGAGYVAAALVLGTAAPLAAAGLAANAGRDRRPAGAVAPRRARFRPNRGVLAGWAVAALVLAGYWTVLTRLAVALGDQQATDLMGVVPLLGALGLPLAVVAGRLSDRLGPRAPMVAATGAGAAGFAVAGAAPTPVAFAAAAAVGLAFYWAYLPVVAAQVQHSAPAEARGRAAAGLYASMWLGAAVAGAAGPLAPSWRHVLVGAGLSWGVAAVVAARGFHGERAGGFRPWRRPVLAAPPSQV